MLSMPVQPFPCRRGARPQDSGAAGRAGCAEAGVPHPLLLGSRRPRTLSQVSCPHAGEVPGPKTAEQLQGQDVQKLEYRIAMLEEELRVMDPDMGAIEDYRRKDAEHAQRLTDLEALTAERDQVRFQCVHHWLMLYNGLWQTKLLHISWAQPCCPMVRDASHVVSGGQHD